MKDKDFNEQYAGPYKADGKKYSIAEIITALRLLDGCDEGKTEVILEDTHYVGEPASKIFIGVLSQLELIASGGVYMLDGVNKKFTIPYEEPNTLEPESFTMNSEFVPSVYEADYTINKRTDQTFNDYIIEQKSVEVASYIDNLIWRGRKSFHPHYQVDECDASVDPWAVNQSRADFQYNLIDGLIYKLLNNNRTELFRSCHKDFLTSDEQLYHNVKGLISRSNDKFSKNNIPYKILMSKSDFDTYKEYLKTAPYGLFLNDYSDHIISLSGIPKGTMLSTRYIHGDSESNIWIGFNSRSDSNKVAVHKLQHNTFLWSLSMILNIDINVSNFGDCILFTNIKDKYLK